ncbi:hypothetical protein R1sor_018872 [Riccia sorocarpa]|uniref:Uncharacterized protein n=1 Tax=Riccia sorocarpa TaxID=122646 RepID=A0ABD3IEQ1_9MARC
MGSNFAVLQQPLPLDPCRRSLMSSPPPSPPSLSRARLVQLGPYGSLCLLFTFIDRERRAQKITRCCIDLATVVWCLADDLPFHRRRRFQSSKQKIWTPALTFYSTDLSDRTRFTREIARIKVGMYRNKEWGDRRGDGDLVKCNAADD